MDNASEGSAKPAAPGETGAAAPGIVRVRLLGGLAVEVRGQPVPLPRHAQGPALLAWLALHPGEHPRADLAARFWPGLAPSNARRGLREAVWSLRRSLGPLEGAVRDGRDSVGLRCETDVARGGGDGVLLDGAGLDDHDWVLSARAEHARRA